MMESLGDIHVNQRLETGANDCLELERIAMQSAIFGKYKHRTGLPVSIVCVRHASNSVINYAQTGAKSIWGKDLTVLVERIPFTDELAEKLLKLLNTFDRASSDGGQDVHCPAC